MRTSRSAASCTVVLCLLGFAGLCAAHEGRRVDFDLGDDSEFSVRSVQTTSGVVDASTAKPKPAPLPKFKPVPITPAIKQSSPGLLEIISAQPGLSAILYGNKDLKPVFVRVKRAEIAVVSKNPYRAFINVYVDAKVGKKIITHKFELGQVDQKDPKTHKKTGKKASFLIYITINGKRHSPFAALPQPPKPVNPKPVGSKTSGMKQ